MLEVFNFATKSYLSSFFSKFYHDTTIGTHLDRGGLPKSIKVQNVNLKNSPVLAVLLMCSSGICIFFIEFGNFAHAHKKASNSRFLDKPFRKAVAYLFGTMC